MPRNAAPEVTLPDAVARFRADFERVNRAAPAASERIALAVSGGPDSMAMLALAAAGYPGQVIAATVDHGLRSEAAAEAALVAGCCAELGVPHATLRVTAPLGPSAIQADAREARYALLADWAAREGASVVLTAHHADDQAETFLMRAIRGTGPAGLAGIRPRRALGEVTLLRPLLGWTRAALHAIAAPLPFVDDPSNADLRFERTRVRQLLAANPWLDPAGLAAAAAHAGEADAALAALAAQLWDTRRIAGKEGEVLLDIAELPREAQRRLTRRAIGHVRGIHRLESPPWSEATRIESLLDALTAGRGASLAGVMASMRGTIWRFRLAPPRRSH